MTATYTEYKVQYLSCGKWYSLSKRRPKSLQVARHLLEKDKHELSNGHERRPDIYPEPEAWRIVSREVTVTEWMEV